MMGGGSRMEMRRIRNRTLSGLESMSHRAGMGGPVMTSHGPMDMARPGSAGPACRPITPSFANEKDLTGQHPGQQFVDFNPAGEYNEI